MGAILIFGLFATTAALYTVNTLPEWVADNEQKHMEQVQLGMDLLKGSLDALAASGSASTASATFALGAEKVALLQPVAASGQLTGTATGVSTLFSVPGSELHYSNGDALATPVERTTALTNVKAIQGLVLSLSTNTLAVGGSAFARIVASDASGTTPDVTATVTHFGVPVTPGPCGTQPELRYTLAVGATTTKSITLLCGLGSSITDRATLLTEEQYGFSQAVASTLEAPYSLTLSDSNGATACPPAAGTGCGRIAAITVDATTGLWGALGTGQATSLGRTLTGGSILFDPQNQRYVDQSIGYEGGAVMRLQRDGEVVATFPSFTLESTGASSGALEWTYTNVLGEGSLGGTGTASVSGSLGSATSLLLTKAAGGTAATFTVTSAAAGAWCNFFHLQRLASGMSAVTVTPAASTGCTSTLASTTLTLGTARSWSIRLNFADANLRVQ